MDLIGPKLFANLAYFTALSLAMLVCMALVLVVLGKHITRVALPLLAGLVIVGVATGVSWWIPLLIALLAGLTAMWSISTGVTKFEISIITVLCAIAFMTVCLQLAWVLNPGIDFKTAISLARPWFISMVAMAIWYKMAFPWNPWETDDVRGQFAPFFANLPGECEESELRKMLNGHLTGVRENWANVKKTPPSMFWWAINNPQWVDYQNSMDELVIYRLTGKMPRWSSRITVEMRLGFYLGKIIHWLKNPYIFWGD